MAIRHTRGSHWITEGELPGSILNGYAIEDTDLGVSPSGAFAFGRNSSELPQSSEMPERLRHSHGGKAGYYQDGYSEKTPSWHKFSCRVPECPASNIWPCVRIILGRKCDYCGDNINNP